MPLEAVLCTCGKNIGSHIPVYDFCAKRIREAFREANLPAVAIDTVQLDNRWTVELGPLLDALHIERECCRTTMLAKVKVANLQ